MNFIACQTLSRRLASVLVAVGFSMFYQVALAAEVATPRDLSEPVDTPAPENVQPELKPEPNSLVLRVSGSSAGITTNYFESAATEALIASGIFSVNQSTSPDEVMPMIRSKAVLPRTVETDNVAYLLDIRIIKVDSPSFGVHMAVGMHTVWVLYHLPDKVELLHEKVFSTYTGGIFEGGIHGANRVRVAMEGAERENIRIGMTKLASLDLANR